MKNEVYLKDLVPQLDNFLVKLDPNFLRKLMVDSSKCKKPWKNRKYVEYIGYTFNKKAKCSTALQAVFRDNRVVKISVIKRMLKLSKFSWKDLEKGITSLRAGRNRGDIKINFPILIDQKLGSITGHILGDGSIEKYYSQPFFSNKNKELLKEFDGNIKKIFGINGRIWIQSCDFINKSRWTKRIRSIDGVPSNMQAGLFYTSTVGVILHVIFGEFAKGKKKKITPQILNSNKEFKKGLIRAFFDDEGSVQSSHRIMRFYQDNKELLVSLKKIIEELNIKTNPIRNYYKKGKIRYYFNITGYRNYYKFYHLIGCTSTKKKGEFQLWINQAKNSTRFKKKFALQPSDYELLQS